MWPYDSLLSIFLQIFGVLPDFAVSDYSDKDTYEKKHSKWKMGTVGSRTILETL